jgi:general secretion pathway protein A
LYLQYFGLNEPPFAITPDPAFVYLSAAHRDALAHLLYGVGQGGAGGFVQLTGEVGTGKTTLCRCLLEQVPAECHVALVLNPLMTPNELLATICEELEVDTTGMVGSNKLMVDALNAYLLEQHAQGRRVVVVIDEAQNLSPEALEQVRLLTNLETAKHKLLQMVLLGQPELRALLQRQDLRQLAQRITARYHLAPLQQQETAAYVLHRMKVAGALRNPFSRSALRALHRRSGGVPRLINIIADRALAAAYAREAAQVSAPMVNQAADEVQPSEARIHSRRWPTVAAAAAAFLAAGLAWFGAGWWGSQDTSPSAVTERAAGDSAVAAADRNEGPGTVAPAQVVAAGRPPAERVETEAAAEGAAAAGPQTAGPAAAVDPVVADDPTAALGEVDPGWLDRQHQSAWQTVAGLWQEADAGRAIQAACDGVRRTGFACILDQGNWSRIRQLGLPVVLVLRGEKTRLLVFRGFTDGALLVGGSEAGERVAREAVEQFWLGEYYVAWPQAPDWPTDIQRGESGAAVDIVMEMASYADPAWSGSGVFDEHFEAWLVAYQRRNGLKADGIIGPHTLMYLMAPTIVQPRLLIELAEGG